jgi:hypothetical protein
LVCKKAAKDIHFSEAAKEMNGIRDELNKISVSEADATK